MNQLVLSKKGVTMLDTSEPYQIIWTRHLKNKRFAQLTIHKMLGLTLSIGDYLATEADQVETWILNNNVLNLRFPKETIYA